MAFCPNCGASVEGRYCAKCGTAVDSGAAPAVNLPPISAAGLPENTAAALCYLLGLVTGIIFGSGALQQEQADSFSCFPVDLPACDRHYRLGGPQEHSSLGSLAAGWADRSGLFGFVGLLACADLSGEKGGVAGNRRSGGEAGIGEDLTKVNPLKEFPAG